MRRRLAITALMLALGLITSIAIAWAFAAWRPVNTDVPRNVGVFAKWDRAWHSIRVSQSGATIRLWGDYAADEQINLPIAEFVKQQQQEYADPAARRARYPLIPDHRTPRWGTFAQPEPPPPPWIMGSDTAFGWPFRCMWHQVLTSFDAATMSTTGDKLVGGHLLRGYPSGVMSDFAALPLRPIPTGLILNTAFYALLWAALFTTLLALRRRARRRANRCINCGYHLAGLREPTCPECGSKRDRENDAPVSSSL